MTAMTQYGTPEETMLAYANISAREKQILLGVARKYIQGTHFSEPLDLMHEALFLTLDQRRRWPKSVIFEIYMVMTMRSIAGADRNKQSTRTASGISIEDIIEWSFEGENFHISAEEKVLQAEARLANSISIKTILGQLRASADIVAGDVLACLLSDMPAREIRSSLGLTVAAYDAARKRVLRKFKKSERL
ncbi:hypothetical protein OX462_12185 [Janthinobacterium sp. SUN098]|uniref:hypothetical protein n=1 Tax=Janthinobacterium sp. SUN098 TaxID=3002437 RepID=UPI0038D5066A